MIVFFYKGDKESINKLANLIGRIEDAFLHWEPINPQFSPYSYGGCAFYLSEKLDRKLKLLKINDKNGRKKYHKLQQFVSKSKRFSSVKEMEDYLSTLEKVLPKKRYPSYNYVGMPSDPHKDNQKIYLTKETKWDKISDKNKLIKEGSKIYGIKIRRPKKSASKRKWKNFLNRFANEK